MRAKDTFFYKKNTLCCGGRLLELSIPLVMGILNVTPDSFYDGGKFTTEEGILERVKKMLEEGASIIDVGAYSSRPGAADITIKEELNRLIPAIRLIKKEFPGCIISADTFRAEVAARAVENGADIINDIGGGTLDAEMFKTIAALKVPYILMHIKGTPQNMKTKALYSDVVKEVMFYFSEKAGQLKAMGVNDIIIDPGFGFGKTAVHNYQLINHIDDFKIFDLPVLAGVSRKSMINEVLGIKAAEALNGTTVLNTLALLKGANILRVHDVKEAVEAVKIVRSSLDLAGLN